MPADHSESTYSPTTFEDLNVRVPGGAEAETQSTSFETLRYCNRTDNPAAASATLQHDHHSSRVVLVHHSPLSGRMIYDDVTARPRCLFLLRLPEYCFGNADAHLL